MKKQAKRVYNFEDLVPPPPPMMPSRRVVTFSDLSMPLRIAAFMGLVEFALLAIWLVFMIMVAVYIVASSI